MVLTECAGPQHHTVVLTECAVGGARVSKDSLFIDKWGLAFFLHPTYPEKRCQENLQRDESVKQRSGQQAAPGQALGGILGVRINTQQFMEPLHVRTVGMEIR